MHSPFRKRKEGNARYQAPQAFVYAKKRGGDACGGKFQTHKIVALLISSGIVGSVEPLQAKRMLNPNPTAVNSVVMYLGPCSPA